MLAFLIRIGNVFDDRGVYTKSHHQRRPHYLSSILFFCNGVPGLAAASFEDEACSTVVLIAAGKICVALVFYVHFAPVLKCLCFITVYYTA